MPAARKFLRSVSATNVGAVICSYERGLGEVMEALLYSGQRGARPLEVLAHPVRGGGSVTLRQKPTDCGQDHHSA